MLRRLRNLFQPNNLSSDIRAELEFHQSQSNGSFGNATRIAEDARDASIVVWLEALVQDVRYGARQLRKSPLLVTVAILSLALGIGANSAIFTLINAVMLQSLPVRDPGKLVLFYNGAGTGVYSGDGPADEEFSLGSAEYLQAHNEVFDGLCSFRQATDRATMHVNGASDSGPLERVRAHLVSGNYFQVLGVEAAAGRVLRQDDDRIEAAPVAVLSYTFWKTRFGMDRGMVGKSITLNGGVFTIAGVAAPEFFGERMETAPEFWVPLSWQPQLMQRESWLKAKDTFWLNMMGRLKPGMSRQKAQSAMTLALKQYFRNEGGAKLDVNAQKKIAALHVQLKPGGSGISNLRVRYSEPLHILMAVVGLVLLIACANIATLLLARDAARRPEFLARLALGASRGRLLRQVLTESVLLSVLGGLAGALCAWGSARLLVLSLHIQSVVKVKPDLTVLLFTLGLAVGTGLLFGIIPAIRSSRMDLRPGASSSRGNSPRRTNSAQLLIVLQVALSLTLLLSSGLLVHSLASLTRQNTGFDKNNLLIVQTDPRLAGYERTGLFSLYRTLDDRLNRIPGVQSASVARYTPVSGSKSTSDFSMQGYASRPGDKLDIDTVDVAPRFFDTLRIPLLLGRFIDVRDTPASGEVAVVNEMFVKTFLPGQNPLGRRILFGAPFKAPGAEIVGVVGNSKFFDLQDDVKPMAFFSVWQTQRDSSFVYIRDIVVRTTQSPLAATAAVRKALADVSRNLPVLRVTTMTEQIDHSLEQQQLMATLCSVFGLVAVVLACIGIYGTLAYSVARRKPEIGIRMAIGARQGHVLWMVLRESVTLVIAGVLLGLPLAYWAGTAIRSYLFGVSLLDPLAMGVAVAAIGGLSLIAGYLPARRATKVDPISALRYE